MGSSTKKNVQYYFLAIRRIASVFSLLGILCLVLNNAHASSNRPCSLDGNDPCEGALQVALHTIRIDTTKNYKENLATWLKTATIDELRHATSASLPISIPGAEPISIGPSFSDENYHKLQEYKDQGLIDKISNEEAIGFFESFPDKDALAVWIKCIDDITHQYGLTWTGYARGEDPKYLVLSLIWRPTGDDSLLLSDIGGSNVIPPKQPDLSAIERRDGSRTFVFTIKDPTKDAWAYVSTHKGLAETSYNVAKPPPPPSRYTVNVKISSIDISFDYKIKGVPAQDHMSFAIEAALNGQDPGANAQSLSRQGANTPINMDLPAITTTNTTAPLKVLWHSPSTLNGDQNTQAVVDLNLDLKNPPALNQDVAAPKVDVNGNRTPDAIFHVIVHYTYSVSQS